MTHIKLHDQKYMYKIHMYKVKLVTQKCCSIGTFGLNAFVKLNKGTMHGPIESLILI